MRKLFMVMAVAIVNVAMLSSCKKEADPETPATATMDYSQAENWLRYESNPTHDVDLFYILPTVIDEGADSVVSFGESDKEYSEMVYTVQAKALEDFTNVYAPYYRQVPLNIAAQFPNSEDYARLVKAQAGKDDIYAALDYYFEHVNNGRPYILASHSQGSAMMRAVLEEYMKSHPDRYARMVACYAIGYALPNRWFDANPHLKKATDATGTGVVIGWNMEGPNATSSNMLISGDDYVINPLTWSTDTTYVPATENHGSLSLTNFQIVTPGEADAQIDNNRHVLVCTTITAYTSFEAFGDRSLHTWDWPAYYVNIQENAQARINAYLGK